MKNSVEAIQRIVKHILNPHNSIDSSDYILDIKAYAHIPKQYLVKEDLVLYRGISVLDDELYLWNKHIGQPLRYRQKSPKSWSLDPSIAQKFAGKGNSGVGAILTCKKYVKAVKAYDIAQLVLSFIENTPFTIFESELYTVLLGLHVYEEGNIRKLKHYAKEREVIVFDTTVEIEIVNQGLAVPKAVFTPPICRSKVESYHQCIRLISPPYQFLKSCERFLKKCAKMFFETH